MPTGEATACGLVNVRAKGDGTMSNGDRERTFALRLYIYGEGTGQLLCDYSPEHECPQWHYGTEKRLTWATAEEALDYLTFEVHKLWPEFRKEDVRVVRVMPPTRETYVEVTQFHVRPSSQTA